MTSDTDAPRSPGRPRSTRVDEAIIDAALDLLAEGHAMEALSIEAIAARAGVGKATIYRRWPGKDALLLDAVRTLKPPVPIPPGRSVREDLITLLSGTGGHSDSRAVKILPCLLPEAQRGEAQRKFFRGLIEPRREAMRQVLRRGVDSGELRPDLDVELVALMLTGPVLMQRMFKWSAELDDRDLPARVVSALLDGVAGVPAGGPTQPSRPAD